MIFSLDGLVPQIFVRLVEGSSLRSVWLGRFIEIVLVVAYDSDKHPFSVWSIFALNAFQEFYLFK